MAGFQNLIHMIYHEKQEPGSALCAQHALNNLLQGSYFTVMDLSAIAGSLDVLEESYHPNTEGRPSINMDDTGFFSIQVLENALEVWGLSLLRWRSEAMRPYQQKPHTQLAFILNLEEHWFTLRRFGRASADMDADTGNGHWFNLNSFLESPEWVSKTYLGMTLQQAEAEGYAVFAVTQRNIEGELALSRTGADELAASLPEPSTSAGFRLSTSREARASGPSAPHSALAGFEDEDMELQAALQASLMGGAADELLVPEEPQRPLGGFPGVGGQMPQRSGSGSGTRTPRQRMPGSFGDETGRLGGGGEPIARETDPVAASMARNRALMERMRREQEMALREGYDEEIARIEATAALHRQNVTQPQRQPGASRPVEDDDEMLRRAIEESRALAEGREASLDEEIEENMDVDVNRDAPRIWMPPSAPAPANPAAEFEEAGWEEVPEAHRVYDDDDEQLQAALRASLETVPEGFRIPEEQPLPPRQPPVASTTSPAPVPTQSSRLVETTKSDEEDSELEYSELESEADSSSAAAVLPPAEEMSMEEIRRRRLARFGA